MELNKSQFDRTFQVPFLKIDKLKMEAIMPFLRPIIFKKIKITFDNDPENEDLRHVLLNPEKVKCIQDLGHETLIQLDYLKLAKQLEMKSIQLNYENLSAEEVFREVLPLPPGESLSSWSVVGHIIHLNLKEHLLPYKTLIGNVLLDKNPSVRLVVNKTSEIESEFRVFPMEILASKSLEETTLVEVKASGCIFKFDFAKVYWNPRLDTEHQRIIDKCRKGMDVLYDVFAGVGPFSVPSAKKCKVLANDLNPESFKWLQINVNKNKVQERMTCYNLDGREFIRTIIREDILKEWQDFDSGEDARCKEFHVVMNLPALAPEFLDSFQAWMEPNRKEVQEIKEFTLPIIHCHCFIKEKDLDQESCKRKAVQLMEKSLGAEIDEIIEVINVRNVAPNKSMYRVSFRLPQTVLFNHQINCKRFKSDQ